MTERTARTQEPQSRRARLAPVLESLKAIPDNAVFLDLCELVLMLAEEIEGSVKWDHPRVVVHVRQRAAGGKHLPEGVTYG